MRTLHVALEPREGGFAKKNLKKSKKKAPFRKVQDEGHTKKKDPLGRDESVELF